MIHINLLPVREIKRRIKIKRQLFIVGFGLIFNLSGLIFYAQHQYSTIQNLKERQSQIEIEKNKYQKIVSQIKKIEEERKVLDSRINIIKSLKKESSLTVHVLDDIASLTPPNRLWLKTLDQSLSRLTLTGMALDDQTIAKYMDDIDKSIYMSSVSLANTTMDKFAERNLKSFTILCSVGIESAKK